MQKSCRCRPPNSKKGLTIVELLVVIAVVTLLAACMFPLFRLARDRGRQIQCISNLRQFHWAYTNYSLNNKGWYPGGTAIAGTVDGWIVSSQAAHDPQDNHIWGGARLKNVKRGVLWSYIEDKGIYVCPGDKDRKERGFSYSQNVVYAGINMNAIQPYLSHTALMVEEQHPNDGSFWYKRSGPPGTLDCLSYNRHCTSACILFGDGGVEARAFSRLDTVSELAGIGDFPPALGIRRSDWEKELEEKEMGYSGEDN